MGVKVLTVRVIPNSKVNKLIETKDDTLKIKLMAPAHEGKANKALISFLAEHFNVSKNKIVITSGEKSREKKVKIGE